MISEPFIRRPIATSLLMAAILIAGIVAFRQLGIASLPPVDLPTIRVFAALPGASPETMASAVARPLERELGQISAISELTSVSTLGQTTILVQFELSRSIDDAARDVAAAINAASSVLPKDLPNPPIYRKSNPSLAPLVILAVTCDTLPAGAVFDYADSVIAQKLAQIEGVSEVTVSGAEKSAVRVQIVPAALAATGLGFEDVRAAVAQAGVIGPKGSLDGKAQTYTVTANDQLFDADAYRKIIVGYANGAAIRLDDLGSVVNSVADTRTGGWFNGKRAVIVVVMREPGANVVETAARVRDALPQLERWMPPAVKVDVLVDRTATIRVAVSEVEHVLLASIALVIIGVFVFLRRLVATIIPCTVIPVAIAGTFGVMYLCGYTLDNLSILALAVASGFLIDDAIVMTENIARFREAGYGPVEAALAGSRQITFTIVAITASLLAAFAPLFLMPGIVGRFFVEFAVTLSASVIISAIVSLTMMPMMCARFLGDDSQSNGQSPAGGGAARRAGVEPGARLLSAQPDALSGASAAAADGHAGGARRHDLALYRGAERLYSRAGHVGNFRHHRGIAGHFLYRDGRAAGPCRQGAARRPGGGQHRVVSRAERGRRDQQRTALHQPRAGGAAARHRARCDGPAAAGAGGDPRYQHLSDPVAGFRLWRAPGQGALPVHLAGRRPRRVAALAAGGARPAGAIAATARCRHRPAGARLAGRAEDRPRRRRAARDFAATDRRDLV